MRSQLLSLLLLSPYLAVSIRAEATVQPVLLVEGLRRPVFLTHAGDGSQRLFVLEQPGRIRIIQDGQLLTTPFLDISSKLESTGEKGLLGLAFHPSYPENGRFFVNYTRRDGEQLKTVIAEYGVSQDDPNQADEQEKILLEFNQPYDNHNGGMLAFGPDGFLYIATGDGGGARDPQNRAQNLGSVLGKILRIDIDSATPYAIPPSNPFTGVQGVREEIFAHGLRNPWRFSFDRLTGRLVAGDVGQAAWEEIDLIVSGGNYGWKIMEGNHCLDPAAGCSDVGLIRPIAEYGRDEGRSITGGYFYRGSENEPIWGWYLFGDYVSGNIWALSEEPGGTWKRALLAKTSLRISSFGEDEAGEVYVLNHLEGEVWRLAAGWRERFAHIGDGTSPYGTFHSTVIVINEEDEVLDGELRLIANDGTDFSNRQIQLGAGSSVAMETKGDTNPLFVGWAEVTANRRFSGLILFTLKTLEGEPLAEAGIASSNPGQSFIAHVAHSTRFATSTGLALANISDSKTVTITVTLSQTGQAPLEATLDLGPGEQTAKFIDEIDGVPNEFEGTARIEATGEILVTLLRTKDGLQFSGLPVVIK